MTDDVVKGLPISLPIPMRYWVRRAVLHYCPDCVNFCNTGLGQLPAKSIKSVECLDDVSHLGSKHSRINHNRESMT